MFGLLLDIMNSDNDTLLTFCLLTMMTVSPLTSYRVREEKGLLFFGFPEPFLVGVFS